MISISWFDSDPYTGINILEDGVVLRKEHVTFSYEDFELYIDKEGFVANTVNEMSKKIEEFQAVKRKSSFPEIMRALGS